LCIDDCCEAGRPAIGFAHTVGSGVALSILGIREENLFGFGPGRAWPKDQLGLELVTDLERRNRRLGSWQTVKKSASAPCPLPLTKKFNTFCEGYIASTAPPFFAAGAKGVGRSSLARGLPFSLAPVNECYATRATRCSG